jgi:hypothetical protein
VDDRILKSRRQEKRIATKVGGTLNAGSGNGNRKNDVRQRGEVLWEMKRTDSRSITIKATDLRDLRKQASLEGRLPVMQIELGGRRYVVIEEDDFLSSDIATGLL